MNGQGDMSLGQLNVKNMKQIKLTQGKIALVDDSDYVELSKYKWYASKYKNIWYAERMDKLPSGKRCVIRMHRQIFRLIYKDNKYVDHRNHNGLDNQKNNLRVCMQAQNCYNKRHQNSKTSEFKGVSWCNVKMRWRASITYKNKHKFLGYFDLEAGAALAYNKAAKNYFGEFAYLNKVQK